LTPDAIETIRQEYQKAEQKLNKLLDTIKTYDPTFSLTQRVETIKFSEIQGLLDEHTALIEWYCTREQIYAFVVTGGEPPPPHPHAVRGAQTSRVFWQRHPYPTLGENGVG
jgi:hypothetical protein